MLAACVLLAAMGTCVYAVTLLETPVVSFVWVVVNLLIVLCPASVNGQVRALMGEHAPLAVVERILR